MWIEETNNNLGQIWTLGCTVWDGWLFNWRRFLPELRRFVLYTSSWSGLDVLLLNCNWFNYRRFPGTWRFKRGIRILSRLIHHSYAIVRWKFPATINYLKGLRLISSSCKSSTGQMFANRNYSKWICGKICHSKCITHPFCFPKTYGSWLDDAHEGCVWWQPAMLLVAIRLQNFDK